MAQADGTVDISHVCKLTRAARKQDCTGHHARAVELYERAIAAAEALRQPDCLIVASLRAWCLETQYYMAVSAGEESDDSTSDAYADALLNELLPGVLETLERRRAAGTLQPGRCRAHEVAWCADFRRAEGGPVPDEAAGLSQAQLVGVRLYFLTARTAATSSLAWLEAAPGEAPLLDRCLAFVEQALKLALQRQHSETATLATAHEPLFLDEFRTRLLPYLEPEKPRCARVLAAWRDVERSGILDVVPFGTVRKQKKQNERHMKSLADAQAAKDAGVPRRTCALPACGAREAHVGHFKRCGACGGVFYCSKGHQAEHWPAHKAACKAARKAAGEGGAPQDA